MCILCVQYIRYIKKVIMILSVLATSVVGFQKKVWIGEGGWDELYPFFLGIFEKKIQFAKPLMRIRYENG